MLSPLRRDTYREWLATQTRWNAYIAGRALRRYVRWYAAEYDTDDWSRDIPCRLPRSSLLSGQRPRTTWSDSSPPATRPGAASAMNRS